MSPSSNLGPMNTIVLKRSSSLVHGVRRSPAPSCVRLEMAHEDDTRNIYHESIMREIMPKSRPKKGPRQRESSSSNITGDRRVLRMRDNCGKASS